MSFSRQDYDTKATRTLNSCDKHDHAICCFKNWALPDVGFKLNPAIGSFQGALGRLPVSSSE